METRRYIVVTQRRRRKAEIPTLSEILAGEEASKEAFMPLLLKVQSQLGRLSLEDIRQVALFVGQDLADK